MGGGSVPVVLPGVANMAGNPPGARQGRAETWREILGGVEGEEEYFMGLPISVP